MRTVMVIVLFALTVALDWLPGIKTKPVRESVVYGLMTSVALIVLFLYSIGVNINGPTGVIRSVVEAIIPVK